MTIIKSLVIYHSSIQNQFQVQFEISTVHLNEKYNRKFSTSFTYSSFDTIDKSTKHKHWILENKVLTNHNNNFHAIKFASANKLLNHKLTNTE